MDASKVGAKDGAGVVHYTGWVACSSTGDAHGTVIALVVRAHVEEALGRDMADRQSMKEVSYRRHGDYRCEWIMVMEGWLLERSGLGIDG